METSTLADFIASFGGLLGLFMGISVLSIFEIVYYFTLRLICQLGTAQRSHFSAQPPTERIHLPEMINRDGVRRNSV